MDQPEKEKEKVLTKQEKKKLYQHEYYRRTKDLNKEQKLQKQLEANRKYKEKNEDKVKQYRENYYAMNPNKFKEKNKKCELCNYIGTSSNVSRHMNTIKHKDNEIKKLLES